MGDKKLRKEKYKIEYKINDKIIKWFTRKKYAHNFSDLSKSAKDRKVRSNLILQNNPYSKKNIIWFFLYLNV